MSSWRTTHKAELTVGQSVWPYTYAQRWQWLRPSCGIVEHPVYRYAWLLRWQRGLFPPRDAGRSREDCWWILDWTPPEERTQKKAQKSTKKHEVRLIGKAGLPTTLMGSTRLHQTLPDWPDFTRHDLSHKAGLPTILMGLTRLHPTLPVPQSRPPHFTDGIDQT